eukprot:1195325-Prorocentrum_minimum.AAC.1
MACTRSHNGPIRRRTRGYIPTTDRKIVCLTRTGGQVSLSHWSTLLLRRLWPNQAGDIPIDADGRTGVPVPLANLTVAAAVAQSGGEHSD